MNFAIITTINVEVVASGHTLKKALNSNEDTILKKLQPNFEHIWLEITGKSKNSNLLGVIYRSDKIMCCNDWIEKFDDLLSNVIPTWDGMFMIVGNMNINLLDGANPVVMKYVNILQLFNLMQHILQPTRSTAVSCILIDNLITSNPSKISHAAVLPCDYISDHDAVYATINVRVSRFTPRYKFIRNEK